MFLPRSLSVKYLHHLILYLFLFFSRGSLYFMNLSFFYAAVYTALQAYDFCLSACSEKFSSPVGT